MRLLFIAFLFVCSSARADFTQVNGMKMYYEVHGTGGDVPLLMIHGGGSTIDSTFSKLLPNARLAILPGGHGSFLQDAAFASAKEPNLTEATASIVRAFLDLNAGR